MRETEKIGDILVAARYADERGWCWKYFHTWTGDSIKVDGKWERVEPFADTLAGRRQLEALATHFHINVKLECDIGGWFLEAYHVRACMRGDYKAEVVTVSEGTYLEPRHYRELYIKYVKKHLEEIDY